MHHSSLGEGKRRGTGWETDGLFGQPERDATLDAPSDLSLGSTCGMPCSSDRTSPITEGNTPMSSLMARGAKKKIDLRGCTERRGNSWLNSKVMRRAKVEAKTPPKGVSASHFRTQPVISFRNKNTVGRTKYKIRKKKPNPEPPIGSLVSCAPNRSFPLLYCAPPPSHAHARNNVEWDFGGSYTCKNVNIIHHFCTFHLVKSQRLREGCFQRTPTASGG